MTASAIRLLVDRPLAHLGEGLVQGRLRDLLQLLADGDGKVGHLSGRFVTRLGALGFRPSATVIVTATTATFGRHHAWFGLNLQSAVDFETPARNNQVACLQTVSDEVVIAGPGTKDDLATFECWVFGVR